jgi:hypothetical protein
MGNRTLFYASVHFIALTSGAKISGLFGGAAGAELFAAPAQPFL